MGRSRAERIGLAAFALVIACDLAYLITVTVLGVDPHDNSAINRFFRISTVWTPVIVFWVAAAVAVTRRRSVFLAAIAVTAWASGSVIYGVLLNSIGRVPSPAASDIGYLAFYGFMVAAFLTLGNPGPRRAIVPVALEAAIASLGTASVLLVFVQPLIDAATNEATPEVGLITLAYPLLDVTLVAVTAGFASSPVLGNTRRVWWFVAGIAAFVSTDLAYALVSASGNYTAGALIDIGWPLGLALMAWWALGFTLPPRDRVSARTAPVLGIVAPLISVVAAISVLVYATQQHVTLAAVVLATITVALTAIPVLTRQTLLSRLIAGQERVLGELRELDLAKTEMMATLNHELRTPLTSVLGYIEVVRDGDGGKIPAEADKMLGAAEHSARRLHSIVDEMLILTRLDSHGLDVQMHPIDPVAVVQRVVEQLQPVADGRQVSLTLQTADAPPLVLGDDSRLGHAVTTVIENAVKFTPNSGSVTVTVSTRRHERPVVITVADTGMGVPPDDLPRLFERFYRASNAAQSAVGGSGLGLAIARGIVELHGGRIRAESVLGAGTTMTITLPAAE